MIATLQTQDSILYQLAAQMMAACPAGVAGDADRARIDRAMDLVGSVERTISPSVYLVRSASEPNRAYRVQNNLCNCPDTPRERGATCCKHSYAVQFFNRLERADAEQSDPTPITIHVQSEESIVDLWPVWGGEPCALPAQCPRCHAEPRSARHREGLGHNCLMIETFGPQDAA